MTIRTGILIRIIIVIITFCVVATAQQIIEPGESDGAAPPKTSENERIRILEDQVRTMRAELRELRKLLLDKSGPQKAPSGDRTAKSAKSVDSADGSSGTPAVPQNAAAKPTDVKRTKRSPLAFDVGDVTVTPYGLIFVNAFGNSSGTNNTDDPLWATSNSDANASASARQTRLGLRFAGAKFANANVKGVIEADFFGGFPGVGVGENMGVLRLRLANVRLDWEKTSIIAGQDWILFAPNNPRSTAAAAIPQFAAAGNMWSRLTQLRLEQKIGKNFKWQGAIVAPGTGDFPTGGSTPALLQPNTGAASSVPFFQSRLSFSDGNWFGTGKSGTIGIAGHYGRSRVRAGNTKTKIDSVGVAADWSFPIVKRVTLAGEAFFGRNLGGFQAGIFQGYNTSFGLVGSEGSTANIKGIGTRGGWAQLGWNLPALEDKLTVYGSFGIDDPRNEDLLNFSNRNFRSRNLGTAFDVIYKLTPQFTVGFELRRLETSYLFTSKRSSNHFNLGGIYSF